MPVKKQLEEPWQSVESKREKINQLYRFAEFGRLACGVFHDLVNPLTALSLNLKQIDSQQIEIMGSKTYLDQALMAADKIENLLISIKHQLQSKSDLKSFSLNDEVKQIISLLSYKARQANVKLSSLSEKRLSLYGDVIKFNQIITNLVCNAIEACDRTKKKKRKVLIKLKSIRNEIIINIIDNGCGIGDDINKIFRPFFSTRHGHNGGLGIGLYSTKSIVERDFKGKIEVKLGLVTNFTISLPLRTS